MDDQLRMDFDRATKLRIVERARIDVQKGSRTSQAAAKAVLRVIDSHARDDASARLTIDTIATEAGKSRAAIKRAIAELERQSLLGVTRNRDRGKRASEYRIAWANLRELADVPTATPDLSEGTYSVPLLRKLRPTSRADVQNVHRVAALLDAGQIAEHDVAAIIAAMNNRRQPVANPMAYFMNSLRGRLESQGADLRSLMTGQPARCD